MVFCMQRSTVTPARAGDGHQEPLTDQNHPRRCVRDVRQAEHRFSRHFGLYTQVRKPPYQRLDVDPPPPRENFSQQAIPDNYSSNIPSANIELFRRLADKCPLR
jgi:hypothetical protein